MTDAVNFGFLAYGKASTWTSQQLTDITPQILRQIPSSALKDLNPDTVANSIATFRNVRF